MPSTTFAIKAEVAEPHANTFAFGSQKTMYGAKPGQPQKTAGGAKIAKANVVTRR